MYPGCLARRIFRGEVCLATNEPKSRLDERLKFKPTQERRGTNGRAPVTGRHGATIRSAPHRAWIHVHVNPARRQPSTCIHIDSSRLRSCQRTFQERKRTVRSSSLSEAPLAPRALLPRWTRHGLPQISGCVHCEGSRISVLLRRPRRPRSVSLDAPQRHQKGRYGTKRKGVATG